MLVVRGVTYRIERKRAHHYRVVRLLDDLEVGSFQTRPLRIEAAHVEEALLLEVVHLARRSARTSSVMQAAPVYEADRESSPSVIPAAPAEPPRASSAPPVARPPSTIPPPSPLPA